MLKGLFVLLFNLIFIFCFPAFADMYSFELTNFYIRLPSLPVLIILIILLFLVLISSVYALYKIAHNNRLNDEIENNFDNDSSESENNE